MWKFNEALLLINANAGNKQVEKKLKQALPILSMVIKSLRIVHTETLDEVQNLITKEADCLDLLIILGGDGTIHEVINVVGALEKRPIIGILPGGTSNDFSRTLGIPQNLTEASRIIAEGNDRVIDLAKSNSRYFLNFWGIGLISESSENIDEEEKNSFGVLSYFLSTVRSIQEAEPFSYQINNDEGVLEGEAVLIVAFNGRYIGTREVGLESLAPDDGKLDVFIVEESNVASFREIFSAVNPYSQNHSFEEITYFQTKNMQIKTKNPKRIDMDGEIKEETPANIMILPNHLRMIVNKAVNDR